MPATALKNTTQLYYSYEGDWSIKHFLSEKFTTGIISVNVNQSIQLNAEPSSFLEKPRSHAASETCFEVRQHLLLYPSCTCTYSKRTGNPASLFIAAPTEDEDVETILDIDGNMSLTQ